LGRGNKKIEGLNLNTKIIALKKLIDLD
jgi:hypothetical protein